MPKLPAPDPAQQSAAARPCGPTARRQAGITCSTSSRLGGASDARRSCCCAAAAGCTGGCGCGARCPGVRACSTRRACGGAAGCECDAGCAGSSGFACSAAGGSRLRCGLRGWRPRRARARAASSGAGSACSTVCTARSRACLASSTRAPRSAPSGVLTPRAARSCLRERRGEGAMSGGCSHSGASWTIKHGRSTHLSISTLQPSKLLGLTAVAGVTAVAGGGAPLGDGGAPPLLPAPWPLAGAAEGTPPAAASIGGADWAGWLGWAVRGLAPTASLELRSCCDLWGTGQTRWNCGGHDKPALLWSRALAAAAPAGRRRLNASRSCCCAGVIRQIRQPGEPGFQGWHASSAGRCLAGQAPGGASSAALRLPQVGAQLAMPARPVPPLAICRAVGHLQAARDGLKCALCRAGQLGCRRGTDTRRDWVGPSPSAPHLVAGAASLQALAGRRRGAARSAAGAGGRRGAGSSGCLRIVELGGCGCLPTCRAATTGTTARACRLRPQRQTTAQGCSTGLGSNLLHACIQALVLQCTRGACSTSRQHPAAHRQPWAVQLTVMGAWNPMPRRKCREASRYSGSDAMCWKNCTPAGCAALPTERARQRAGVARHVPLHLQRLPHASGVLRSQALQRRAGGVCGAWLRSRRRRRRRRAAAAAGALAAGRRGRALVARCCVHRWGPWGGVARRKVSGPRQASVALLTASLSSAAAEIAGDWAGAVELRGGHGSPPFSGRRAR